MQLHRHSSRSTITSVTILISSSSLFRIWHVQLITTESFFLRRKVVLLHHQTVMVVGMLQCLRQVLRVISSREVLSGLTYSLQITFFRESQILYLSVLQSLADMYLVQRLFVRLSQQRRWVFFALRMASQASQSTTKCQRRCQRQRLLTEASFTSMVLFLTTYSQLRSLMKSQTTIQLFTQQRRRFHM